MIRRVGHASHYCLVAGLMLLPTHALANENCQRLEVLAQQYAGVQLTAAQQIMKRRLTAWYYNNCTAQTASRR